MKLLLLESHGNAGEADPLAGGVLRSEPCQTLVPSRAQNVRLEMASRRVSAPLLNQSRSLSESLSS